MGIGQLKIRNKKSEQRLPLQWGWEDRDCLGRGTREL